MATSIPTRYGMMRTAVSKPPLAPSIKALKMSTFLYYPPSIIKKRIVKSKPLPKEPEKNSSEDLSNVVRYQIKMPTSADKPSIHKRMTG